MQILIYLYVYFLLAAAENDAERMARRFLCHFPASSCRKVTKGKPPRKRVSFEGKRTCRIPSNFNILSLWNPSPRRALPATCGSLVCSRGEILARLICSRDLKEDVSVVGGAVVVAVAWLVNWGLAGRGATPYTVGRGRFACK